jgi:NADP-dependent aldehyde dehydrogenase
MIDGAILIGARALQAQARFRGLDPAADAPLPQDFSAAGASHVAAAAALAADAAPAFAATDPGTRAAFLEAVADAILGIGDALVVRAMAETGLPRARLEGERGRTVAQLRMFAQLVRQGDFLDATIDSALPERQPLPRPDLRRVNIALGPVAVFGASNFPLAFSVAGGDTASALAAGCPVIVKGHPAHPGTGELVARAIQSAVASCGLPEGVFSYLPGNDNALGAALVADPRVKAVGFTGSRAGGLALLAIAAARSEPIPVHAEMSSINPVVLLPHALAARGAALAQAFVGSLTMGAGQFCTNPGLVIALDGPDLDAFIEAAVAALAGSAAQTMLTGGIHAHYVEGVGRLGGAEGVRACGRGLAASGPSQAVAALFETDAERLIGDPALAVEVFGSAALIVRCKDMAQIAAVIAGLEGQLTATLQFDAEDEAAARALLPLLADKVGRVLANGWPTGVEVCPAMVHGGPFPATSDARTTSVGTLAIARFLRPVCFQNLPDALLPPALRAANPWGIARRIDGRRQASPQ